MADPIKIYFATNRDMKRSKKKPFGERFHQEGPHFYRVGMAEVKKVSDDDDEGYSVRQVHVAEEKPPSEKGAGDGQTGSAKIFDELRKQMAEDKRDITIYLHGFANTFESSLERAAQIKQAYLIAREPGAEPYEPHMFAFSWPSNGRTQPPWEYASDRDDAALSGLAMARALRRLIDFLAEMEASRKEKCAQRIHLVAHSMGNWALRHALLGLSRLTNAAQMPMIFDNVLLMAADEDDDALEKDYKLGLLTEIARATHVYHAADDHALIISDTTKFNPNRLGAHGPRSFSGLSSRITAIDCSKVNHTRLAHGNHQYYRLRPEVIADVRHVLSGQYRPDEVPDRVTVEPARRYRLRPIA